MNNNGQLQNIVNDFVQQLSAAWQQSVIEALSSIGGTPGKNGKGTKIAVGNGHANGRSKGEKRSPEEIAALKDKFLTFVTKSPGLRIEQINKELGTSTKDLALPIRQLIADKSIKAKGSKRSTTYAGK
jgi:hypothetical protein